MCGYMHFRIYFKLHYHDHDNDVLLRLRHGDIVTSFLVANFGKIVKIKSYLSFDTRFHFYFTLRE